MGFVFLVWSITGQNYKTLKAYTTLRVFIAREGEGLFSKR